jgi:hypothetical protein
VPFFTWIVFLWIATAGSHSFKQREHKKQEERLQLCLFMKLPIMPVIINRKYKAYNAAGKLFQLLVRRNFLLLCWPGSEYHPIKLSPLAADPFQVWCINF